MFIKTSKAYLSVNHIASAHWVAGELAVFMVGDSGGDRTITLRGYEANKVGKYLDSIAFLDTTKATVEPVSNIELRQDSD